jgi:SAM-dependent methyltransferase
VLDVGCGTGRALVRLAAAFPHSRFQGVDLSELAIESARREARARGLGNLRFDARDPAALDEPSRFDLITTFAIHRQPAPAAVLAGIASALRLDGVFLMQENAGAHAVRQGAARPFATFLYSSLWGWRAAGRLLAEAGFGNVVVQALPHAPLHLFYVARKARPL